MRTAAAGACASAGCRSTTPVADALLAALTPAGVKAALTAAESLEADPQRAECRYHQVEPEHRLVARGLERDWEKALSTLADAEAELTLREHQRPRVLTDTEREQLLSLGADLGRVWASTHDNRPRPQTTPAHPDRRGHPRHPTRTGPGDVTIRWRGGAITELAVPLPRHQPTIRTDEDTITLLGRLAAHYDDATIAGILNRQGRRSATGQRFTAQIVSSLRNHYKIPRYQPPTQPPAGEPLPISKAAEQLGVAASTLHRWLEAGFIAGEQDTRAPPSRRPCRS